MSATYRLFERWMAAKGIASERAALRQLGVSATVAQHWKNGRNGSLAIIEKMADDLGEDYVPIVMAAFTETAPNEPEKKAWRRLAKRVVGSVVLAAVLYSPTPEVTAATIKNGLDKEPGVYIMRSMIRCPSLPNSPVATARSNSLRIPGDIIFPIGKTDYIRK